MTRQSAFRAALLDSRQPAPDGLLDGQGGVAGRRFDVYRNNVAVSLKEALRTGFPVLRKLIGDEKFDRLAGLHLRAFPPTSPLMMHYGTDMPSFLEGFEPLRHIGYLPDVARLELALRESYHAADANPVDQSRLAGLPPEALAGVRLRLAPALRVIPSVWPLFDIWRFNTEEGAPKPRAVAQAVLICRPEYDPTPHPITPAEAVCIERLHEHLPLSDAVSAAEAAGDVDLPRLLGLLVAGHAIIDVST